ncbi:MAG: sugar ABC transporter substrate-binding protein [Rubellimicrobium sp.]|nr:sugar ABC transporter substrate-binding protein [Rubellimicrobium sp.]
MIRDFLKSPHGRMVQAAGVALALTFGASAADAQVKGPEDVRIVFVTHGQANDVYWTVVKNGMLAAAEQLGVTVDYQAPETFDVVRMARMIEAATASNPDGIVVSIPDADALHDPIEAAKAAGIPVVVIDSGMEQVENWGLDLYVGGHSEYDNGVRAGQIMAEAGVSHGICVNHEVGNVSLDLRCQGYNDGLAESGGGSEVVASTMDPTDVTHRVEAYLTAHPEVTGVLTLGPTVAAPILKMFEDQGTTDNYRLASFDLSPEILDAVANGSALFAIDNQQFLMGYYPVMFLASRAMYRTFPTDNVWTGPSFITAEDAAAVRDLSRQGIR